MPNQDNRHGGRDPVTSLKFVPYNAPDQLSDRTVSVRKRKAAGDDAASSVKIRIACSRCRQKKTRCSGHNPCLSCQQNKESCNYMATATPRSDHSARHGPGQASNDPSQVSPGLGLDGSLVNEQAEFWAAQSPFGVTTSPVEHDQTQEDALQKDGYGHFHGEASEFAFLHFAKDKFASLPSMSIHFHDFPLVSSGKYMPVLPPKTIGDDIVHTFFDFGLTTSRFIHEPSFLSRYEAMYDTSVSQAVGAEDASLICMVMALGSHYSSENDAFRGYSASIRFFDMANDYLQNRSGQATITYLQIQVLVLHYLLNHSRMHEAWRAFGAIVRDAQALGLHRRTAEPQFDYIAYESRKRLCWVIYINDRILSSIFGRPCALHDVDLDQEECSWALDEQIQTNSIKIAESTAFCPSAGLIHYARLARILGGILRAFYSPAGRMHSISQLHEEATGFETALIDWQKDLPPFLDFASLPVSAMSLMTQRQMCTLKLSQAHASLLLYRPFIIYSMGRERQRISELDQWVRHCHDESIKAAKTVVDECRTLSEQGRFTRAFWFVNYVQFAAIGTLYMYSHLWPEVGYVRDMAEEAMTNFPEGVEGDLVGQRYLQVLTELREITSRGKSVAFQALAEQGLGNAQLPVFEEAELDLEGPWGNLFFDTAADNQYMPL